MIPFNHPKIHRLCKTNGIAFLALFGSYARGNSSAASDIDLLVRFREEKSLLDVVRIERAFAHLFGKKVDLVTERAISPYLKHIIQKDVKVMYDGKK